MLICDSDVCIKKVSMLAHDEEIDHSRVMAWLTGLHFVSRVTNHTTDYVMVFKAVLFL